MTLLLTSQISRHHKVDNITSSPTSLSPLEGTKFLTTNELCFSIVSAASEYPLEIEVNDHFVILYELDGYPIDTIKARRLYLQPGETAKIGLEKMNDDSNDLFLLRLSLPGNTL